MRRAALVQEGPSALDRISRCWADVVDLPD